MPEQRVTLSKSGLWFYSDYHYGFPRRYNTWNEIIQKIDPNRPLSVWMDYLPKDAKYNHLCSPLDPKIFLCRT